MSGATAPAPPPAITVSLVTWEGMRWLPGCLASLQAQTIDDLELLILDNGSSDGSVAWLQERAVLDPRIRLTESPVNLGFARAHDELILAARSDAVLLLNQDVELDPGFVAVALSVLRERPRVGAVQGRLRRLGPAGERTDILDTTGLVMHRDRRVVSRGQLERDFDSSPWRVAGPVWGADGAAPVYRRSALMTARLPRPGGGWEILDEDFFAYKEDVDLAWRLRRLGWQAWYAPDALAWHARGGGDTGAQGWREVVRANMSNSPHVRALSWRNQRLMQVKNEEPSQLIRDLPWVVRRELASWAFVLLADPRRLSAVPALLRALPGAWRKRHAITTAAAAATAAAATAAAATSGEDGSAAPRSALTRLPSPVRRVLAHLERHGARATAIRVSRESYELAREAVRRAIGRPIVPQVGQRDIAARMEQPRRGSTEAGTSLVVAGWAFSAAGMDAVDVYVDRRKVAKASMGRSRPDTAIEQAGVGDVRSSGYSAPIRLADDLAPGRHDIHVVLRDRAGSVRVLTRSIRRVEPGSAYERWHARARAQDIRTAARVTNASRTRLPPVDLVVVDRSGGDLEETLRTIAAQSYRPRRATIVVASDRRGAAASVIERQPRGTQWSVTSEPKLSSVTSGPTPALLAHGGPSQLVGFLAAGELLSPAALALMASCALERDASLVYSDHDSVDVTGRHRRPWFVPDWSPDRLLGQDFVGGVFLVRDGPFLREQLEAVGDPAGLAWRYDLLIRCGEGPGPLEHIPRVLWSSPPRRDAGRADAELQVVQDALARRGQGASVTTSPGNDSGPLRRVEWPIDRSATVSIIVPTTGRPDLAASLVRTLQATSYPCREVVVLDNSRGRHPDGIASLDAIGAITVERDEPFNWSRLCDAGAAVASGELLLFLNDDIVAVEPGWLDELVRHAQRPEVGAVGCMLMFPDGTIQHAGVVLTRSGGGAAHLFEGLDPGSDLYLDMQHLTREVSAVTGACLMVRRAVFDEVGGFDEALAVSGNDIDLCLRIADAGHRVIWTPDSQLIHDASASRAGVSHLADEGRLWERWSRLLVSGDPCSNPNLAQDRTDLALDPGSATRSWGAVWSAQRRSSLRAH